MKRKVIAIFVGLVLVGVLGANYERLETFFLGTKQERFNKAVSKHISVDLIGYNLDKTVSIFDSYSGVVDVTIKNVGSDAITGVKGKVFIFDMYGALKQIEAFSYDERLDVNKEVTLSFQGVVSADREKLNLLTYDKIRWVFRPDAIVFENNKIMASP